MYELVRNEPSAAKKNYLIVMETTMKQRKSICGYNDLYVAEMRLQQLNRWPTMMAEWASWH